MLKLLALKDAYLKNEDGATAIEYGLIAAVLSVALYSGADSLASTVGGQFRKLAEKVDATSDRQTLAAGTAALDPAEIAKSTQTYSIRGPLP